MKTSLFLFVFLIIGFFAESQKAFSEQEDFLKKKAIYLNFFNQKELKYFSEGNFDDQESLANQEFLSLKHRFSNVYVSWFNPIKYKLTWKDSLLPDSRNEAVNKFISLLSAQFGSALTDLNKIGVQKSTSSLPAITKGNVALKPTFDIKSTILLEIYLQVKANLVNVTEVELSKIDDIFTQLEKLDYYNNINVKDSAVISFSNLMNASDFKLIPSLVAAETERLQRNDFSNKIEERTKAIMPLIEGLDIEDDKALKAYIKAAATEFTMKMVSMKDENDALIENWKGILDLLWNSISNPSKSNEGFYYSRDINFEDGKVLQTGITIEEYHLDKTIPKITRKEIIHQSQIKFRKTDWVVASLSAGLIYTDVNQLTYSVADDPSNGFIVKEDTVSKKRGGAALFLNLFANINSRYFAPLLQLGVDPTKQHPFMLLGGGFSIPAARFAITAGGIWTWEAYLQTLSPNTKVLSIGDLEKDIKYNFDFNPKGWYLGLQYNF